jgi:hypothetical protein
MHFLFPMAVLAAAFMLLAFTWTLDDAWVNHEGTNGETAFAAR